MILLFILLQVERMHQYSLDLQVLREQSMIWVKTALRKTTLATLPPTLVLSVDQKKRNF